MSQFGAAGKNPPWMRQTELPLSGGAMLAMAQSQHQTQGGAGLASALNQQQATAQQSQQFGANLAALGLTQNALQATTVLSQPGIALPASLATTAPVGTASMGLPGGLTASPAANMSYTTQQRLLGATPTGVPAPIGTPSQKQRVFTGTVTKLHDNFGFVDEDVFFQTCVIKGSIPKVGERVLVEASYNPNMPFKWNAYRIQLLANQMNSQIPSRLGGQSSVSSHVGANAMAAQTQYINSITSGSGNSGRRRMSSPPMRRDRDMRHDDRRDRYRDRGGRDGNRDGLRDGGRDGLRDNSRDGLRDALRDGGRDFDRDRRLYDRVPERNRSPIRRSPLRDRRSPVPRERDRERERERERDRDAARPQQQSPDRDYRYSQEHDAAPASRKHALSPVRRAPSPPRRKQRVLPRYVVEIPCASLDQKEVGVADLRKRYPNMYVPSDFFHANILWQEAFPLQRPLVLDHACRFHVLPKDSVGYLGDNPAVLDPPDLDFSYSAKVMLLSAPSLEELYHRTCALAEDGEETKLGAIHPARVLSFLVGLKGKSETVAIGGPWSPTLDGSDPVQDPQVLIRTAIRTCRALTGIDLSVCTQWYRIAEICYRRESASSVTNGGKPASATLERVVIFFPDVWRCMPTSQEWADLGHRANSDNEDLSQEEESAPVATDEQGTGEPSHYSGLDPKSMKVLELRNELEARGLSTKGLKSQLTARLSKALKAEAEQVEGVKQETEPGAGDCPAGEKKEDVELQGDDAKELSDEKLTQEDKGEGMALPLQDLPVSPAILAQPSKTAKGGRFDCTVMSLSLLLDYRQEDNKEHSFEVSFFAELFNEMLIRDFGFNIFRALLVAPEPKEEKKRDKKEAKEAKDAVDRKSDRKDDRKEDRKDDRKDDRKEDRKDDRKEDRKTEKKPEKREKKEEDKKNEEEQDESDALSDVSFADGDSEESKDKRHKKDAKRLYRTADKHLLLSFIYFDQNQCGYLFDRDLEEIFYIMGLKLSRGQVRRQLLKVSQRDVVRYRKLTDFPASADDAKTGDQETVEDAAGLDVDEVAKGNWGLLHKQEAEDKQDTNKAPVAVGGMVYHEGSLLDIPKLLKQVDRSEKSRTVTEVRLKDVLEELAEVKESWDASQKAVIKTQGELDTCRQQLLSTEHDLQGSHKQSQELRLALQNCHQHLQATLSSLDTVLNRKDGTTKLSIKPEKME
ncbi:cell division cycle and apoptosis regulator protein 1-like isoform X2 [Ornithodoros turicata]